LTVPARNAESFPQISENFRGTTQAFGLITKSPRKIAAIFGNFVESYAIFEFISSCHKNIL